MFENKHFSDPILLCKFLSLNPLVVEANPRVPPTHRLDDTVGRVDLQNSLAQHAQGWNLAIAGFRNVFTGYVEDIDAYRYNM